MAARQHIPPHGGVHCSFGVAVRYLESHDLAAAHAAPDIFELDEWPDALLALFWTLWGALERGLIHANLDRVEELSPQHWQGGRQQLEEWLGVAASIGLRYFIRHVAREVAHAFIRVDELVAAFPAAHPEGAGKAEASPSQEATSAPHSEDGKAPRETLPERDPERHETLKGWFKDAHAAGASNKKKQRDAVKARAERAGASVTWKEREAARLAAKLPWKPGPKSGS
jgi:hypothetical protein